MKSLSSSHDHATDHAAQDEDEALRERLPRRQASTSAGSSSRGSASSLGAVQLFSNAVNAGIHADQTKQIAARGVSGSSGSLPFLEQVQMSFGHHDVSGVRAHTGSAAAQANREIGSNGYATGDDVAFAGIPDLRLVAHEAAHVVQQRGGVRLSTGVGQSGDVYEQHADAVADLVVRGESAEALLDTMAHRGSGGGSAVQLDGGHHAPEPVVATESMATIAEGHVRLVQFPMLPARVPLGTIAYLNAVNFNGVLDYRIGPRAAEAGHGDAEHGEHGEGHAEEPPVALHVGLVGAGGGGEAGHGGGAHGGGGHGGGGHGGPSVGVEVELSQEWADLGNGAHLEGTVGGEITNHGAAFGFGVSGGTMRWGDLVVPLPSAALDLVSIENGEPHAMVLRISQSLPSVVLHFDTPMHGAVEVTPRGAFEMEFEPNWVEVAPRVAQMLTRLAGSTAGTTAGTTTGTTAGTTATAGTGTAADAAAIGAGGSVLELAAMIAAPLAAEGALLAIFAHDVGRMEDLEAAARSTAQTLFHYCMSYTAYWCNQGGIVTGTGASEGTADARRDVAAFESSHPGTTSLDAVRQLGGPEAIYTRVYQIMKPRAVESLFARSDFRTDSLGGDVIRDRIGQVRWGGPLFMEFGGPPHD